MNTIVSKQIIFEGHIRLKKINFEWKQTNQIEKKLFSKRSELVQ
jgi:hypothetical protein